MISNEFIDIFELTEKYKDRPEKGLSEISSYLKNRFPSLTGYRKSFEYSSTVGSSHCYDDINRITYLDTEGRYSIPFNYQLIFYKNKINNQYYCSIYCAYAGDPKYDSKIISNSSFLKNTARVFITSKEILNFEYFRFFSRKYMENLITKTLINDYNFKLDNLINDVRDMYETGLNEYCNWEVITFN